MESVKTNSPDPQSFLENLKAVLDAREIGHYLNAPNTFHVFSIRDEKGRVLIFPIVPPSTPKATEPKQRPSRLKSFMTKLKNMINRLRP